MTAINTDEGALQQVEYVPGDVFQITEAHGRDGWIGAFVLATEIRPWGMKGFVPRVESHDEQTHQFIAIPWNQLAYVGHAPLIPAVTGQAEPIR